MKELEPIYIRIAECKACVNDEDIKNIDEFVADLHKAMPDGFTIDWDVESVGSPYFDPHPAFGLAVDCVKLRVYPNETDTRGHN